MRPTLMFVLCFLFIGCSVPSLHIRINTALLVKPEEPLCVSIAAASLPPPAHCRLFLTRDNLIVDMVEVTLNRHGDSVVLSILIGVGGPNDAKYRHDALGRRILRYTAVDGKLVYERYFYRRKGNKFFRFFEQ